MLFSNGTSPLRKVFVEEFLKLVITFILFYSDFHCFHLFSFRRVVSLYDTRWLMVKNWLVHRKRSVELASKRTWNKYWVCLKGNVLLFHVCDDGVEVTDDHSPKYKLGL